MYGSARFPATPETGQIYKPFATLQGAMHAAERNDESTSEDIEHTPEQLTLCRRQAEQALETAVEHLIGGSPRRDSDQVRINLDWEIPQHADDLLKFEVRISRLDQNSTTNFAIDLKKLAGPDLQRLHDILVYRPHGYWLARAITWLLGGKTRRTSERAIRGFHLAIDELG